MIKEEIKANKYLFLLFRIKEKYLTSSKVLIENKSIPTLLKSMTPQKVQEFGRIRDKKAKFRSKKATLILLQQLQARYFGNVNVNMDIDLLARNSIGVWVGREELLISTIFPDTATVEERESKYNELLTLINSQL